MKRWLLFRRNLEKPDDPHSLTYYQVSAPADVALEVMVSKYCVINNCQTVNRDTPYGTTAPTTQGYPIISDNLLIAGQRWRIEECFAIAKDKLCLSEYEVRSWCGWHRHMTLVIAAGAFLSVLRHQVEPPPQAQKNSQHTDKTPSSMAAFKLARGLLSPWPELLKSVWKLLFPVAWSLEHLLHWSLWPRVHQATARFFHYKKRTILSST